MKWTKELECGVPVIDHEHKELVAQLASLKEQPDADRIREMLDFLKDYVVQHFTHEQLLQKKTSYPKADEHKETHKKFIQTFIDLDEEYRTQGDNPETRQKVMAAVEQWLRDHIMGQDKEFARYYRNLTDSCRHKSAYDPMYTGNDKWS